MNFQVLPFAEYAALRADMHLRRDVARQAGHAGLEAFEATHPALGRIYVSVDALTGAATIVSQHPLRPSSGDGQKAALALYQDRQVDLGFKVGESLRTEFKIEAARRRISMKQLLEGCWTHYREQYVAQ